MVCVGQSENFGRDFTNVKGTVVKLRLNFDEFRKKLPYFISREYWDHYTLFLYRVLYNVVVSKHNQVGLQVQ